MKDLKRNGSNILLCVLMSVCIIAIMKTTTMASQKKIVANKDYSVSVGSEKTVDLIYTAKGNGYFYFNIKIHDSDGRVEVKANYKTYGDYYISSHEKFKSDRYCFKKGTRVKIKIHSGGSKLSIRLVEKKMNNFEKEKNDTVKNATKINRNKIYSGIAMYDENDWWTFTAPKTGKYSLYVVCCQDDAEIEVDWYNNYCFSRGSDGWKKIDRVMLSKGEKISVRICRVCGDYPLYKLKIR